MQPERLATLAEIEAAVWKELQRATRDKHHEWRTPVLASVGVDDAGQPSADARTVVLREADLDATLLRLYTDSRAAKVAQLRTQPNATLLFWSRRLGWQARCKVRCEVADEGLAVSSRWAGIRLQPAAQDYLSPRAPGAALDGAPGTSLGTSLGNAAGSEAPALAQRECFAVVTAQVTAIDWLELHREGHRRAWFGVGEVRWLQP